MVDGTKTNSTDDHSSIITNPESHQSSRRISSIFLLRSQSWPVQNPPFRLYTHQPAHVCFLSSAWSSFSASFLWTKTHPSSGYALTIRFIGNFLSSTGDIPWLNVTGSINGRPEPEPLYYSPLCDIDIFQEIIVQSPAGDYDQKPRFHRSCPPDIQEGYALISSPPMPLSPQTVPEGRYQIRAEATTQDGRRIFCVEGGFDVTTWMRLLISKSVWIRSTAKGVW